ncbi:Fructosamine/Ketosamine-3-kinase [Alternaria rosae]|uniref:Fructosamine/Ketosamine-3-kinase n=1 Tax=Alternaria rosae TaxID=1187941 RepID=UPI001E8D7693|nr:Fructosamine/Ketosamine-3-kinase [Alternaria rosae]KAH6868861.1 Fructosamine/Ketosamine-3-kinase [Alternaria rosae]
MKPDPAVIRLLGLNLDKTNISSAGGGGSSSASTLKITSQLDDGTDQTFFMKTGSGKEAEVMFQGEYASLQAIHDAVPSLCPQPLGHGRFESQPSTSFLVTEFLNLTGRSSSKSTKALSLAAKLAKLHTTPAPIPQGCDKPVFGFSVTTCCGDTPQDNSYKGSWADFYAENRLRSILRFAEQNGRRDGDVKKLVEQTVAMIVARLIGDDHLNNGKGVTPVVVHGDLWSGNASVGVIGNKKGEPEDVVYDPSACYTHNEFELGAMKMFGGFGGSFLKEYHQLCPKTEPVEEYEDRVKLYELYHHLNHYAMFGGSYRSGAVSIMRDLIKKYGSEG